MLLWSIQHQCAYEKMEQTGVLRADKNFIATDWFEDSYLWMAEQMKKRIGEPPEGVIFPVWAWYPVSYTHLHPVYYVGNPQEAFVKMLFSDKPRMYIE